MIVKARQLAGFDAQLRAGLGLPRPADRERDREDARPQPAAATTCRPRAAPTPPSRSRSRWPTSSAWACSATGSDRYRTMDPANEAGEIRAFKRVIERGFVYRGLKPVYWCFDCGSSLAEFEIEYADKKSQTLDVAFLCAEPDKLAAAFGLATLAKDAFAVIWTTTAWTIPANQALNLNPALDYALVRHRARPAAAGRVAGREVPGALRPDGHGAGHDAWARSSAASTSATRWRMCDAGYDRLSPGLPGRLRHRRRRHRHRALVAGLWRGRLQLLRRARHEGTTTSSTRCRATAATRPTSRCSAARTSGRPCR